MKKIKYLFTMLAAALMFTACSQDPEQYMPTSNSAALVSAHNGVLIYPNNLAEDVTFSWKSAKFINGGDITYTLYGIDPNGNNFVIGTTTDNNAFHKLTLTHSEFNQLLLANGFTPNTTTSMQVFVKSVNSAGEEVNSDPISFNVQPLNADAFVAPVLSPVADFTMTDATASTNVPFNWTAASMESGASITYTIDLIYGASDTLTSVVTDDATTYNVTYESLNDMLVGAGVTEGSVGTFTAVVTAKSDYGSTIKSNVITVNATTYVIPFPVDMGVTGSHQGWAIATAPRLPQATRGQYKGFLDMYNASGTVDFKFTSGLDWSGTNYGGTLAALDTDGGAGNLSIANGIYYWNVVDAKNLTATAIKMETVGLVGSFAASNWGSDVIMTRDNTSNTWKVTGVVFNANEEFKVRFQKTAGATDWDYNLGGSATNLSDGGANIAIAEAGTYDFELDLAHIPYVITYTKQ